MQGKSQDYDFRTFRVQHSELTSVQPQAHRHDNTVHSHAHVNVHTHHHSHAQAAFPCARRSDMEVPYHGHRIDVLLAEQRLKKQHCTLRWWLVEGEVEMQGYIEVGMRPEKMRREEGDQEGD